ncbi:MAG: hypothetical protein IKQ30_10095 [Bacteroidales bacterium]|nr:hypothetical protein [Bacteroidales bacterium]
MKIDLKKIADDADVIIDGFAVEKVNEGFRVFDLNNGTGIAIFLDDGTLTETNMDEIELVIAKQRLNQSIKYID